MASKMKGTKEERVRRASDQVIDAAMKLYSDSELERGLVLILDVNDDAGRLVASVMGELDRMPVGQSVVLIWWPSNNEWADGKSYFAHVLAEIDPSMKWKEIFEVRPGHVRTVAFVEGSPLLLRDPISAHRLKAKARASGRWVDSRGGAAN